MQCQQHRKIGLDNCRERRAVTVSKVNSAVVKNFNRSFENVDCTSRLHQGPRNRGAGGPWPPTFSGNNFSVGNMYDAE